MFWFRSNISQFASVPKNETRTCLWQRLLSVLGSIADGSFRDGNLTAYMPRRGNLAGDNSPLMVVGRAVNGWGDQFAASDCNSPRRVDEIVAGAQGAAQDAHGDQMSWVRNNWREGDPTGYRTNSSAFWRVIRRIVLEIVDDATDDDWSSYLVWSNLYKVSPASGGNPSTKLCNAQQAACANMLVREIEYFQPQMVLFLTGLDWLVGFEEALRIPYEPANATKQAVVQQSGKLQLESVTSQYVVCKRPERKPESAFVDQVLAAFATLNGKDVSVDRPKVREQRNARIEIAIECLEGAVEIQDQNAVTPGDSFVLEAKKIIGRLAALLK